MTLTLQIFGVWSLASVAAAAVLGPMLRSANSALGLPPTPAQAAVQDAATSAGAPVVAGVPVPRPDLDSTPALHKTH